MEKPPCCGQRWHITADQARKAWEWGERADDACPLATCEG
ncbi:hypothetical protein J2X88_004301 [Pseudomonas extremaustralis]|nr:hypothetical protein [Pseudomonas extremaustralis]